MTIFITELNIADIFLFSLISPANNSENNLDLVLSVAWSVGFQLVGFRLSIAWSVGFQLVGFCFGMPMALFDTLGISRCHNTLFLLGPHLWFSIDLIRDLFVLYVVSLMR